MEQPPSDLSPYADQQPAEGNPVFTDPSGQRRRLMRLTGAAASALLLGVLILAGIGLFGGPDTPFSVFGAPRAHGQGHRSDGHRSRRHGAPGQPGSTGQPSSSSPAPGPHSSGSRSASPSPSATSTSPKASPSPAPTNGGGRTPPGRTKTPHPHPSPSSTHAK